MAGIPITLNFDLKAPLPLDSRLLVANTNQLNSITPKYSGMIVYAANTQKLYYLEDLNTNTWSQIGTGSFGGGISLNNVVYTSGDQLISGSKTFIATGFHYSGGFYRYDKQTRTVFEENVFINKINNQTSFGIYNHYFLNKLLPISGQLTNLPVGIRTGNIVNLFFNNSGLNNSIENNIVVEPTVMVRYTGSSFPNNIIPIVGHPFYNNRALKKINYGGVEEFKFTGNLTVTLSNGKTFGKYQNGQVIPASGKTTSEVIRLAIIEEINPTPSLVVTPTELLLGTTNISNVLSRSYNINNPGASVASTTLEWKRGNDSSWTVLDTSTSQTSFTHTFTNTVGNSNSINYQYRVVDSQNTTGIATADVSFLYGNYFGYSLSTSISNITQIEGLGNLILSNSKLRTVNNVTAGVNLYTYYAYVSSAGDLNSIIQDGAAPILGAFTKQSDIGGTNTFGANVTYHIYRSNAPQAFTNNNLTFN